MQKFGIRRPVTVVTDSATGGKLVPVEYTRTPSSAFQPSRVGEFRPMGQCNRAGGGTKTVIVFPLAVIIPP